MSFWSSETLKRRLPSEHLVAPFNEKSVVRCAYELAMGPEAVITGKQTQFLQYPRIQLNDCEPLIIPPGQFGLLLTEEYVKVPSDAIAFISIRAGIKFKGLVNVSGFHVDPGFEGRLKFSVYNAGSTHIAICRGDPVFMIWYANLDSPTADLYGRAKPSQNTISAEDIMRASGEVASPSQLKSDLDSLGHKVNNLLVVTTFLIAIAGTAWVRSLMDRPAIVPTTQPTIIVIPKTEQISVGLTQLPTTRPTASESATDRPERDVDSGRRPPRPSTTSATTQGV